MQGNLPTDWLRRIKLIWFGLIWNTIGGVFVELLVLQYTHAFCISKPGLPNNYSDLKQCRPQRLSLQKKGTLLLINNFYKNKMAFEAEPASCSSTTKTTSSKSQPTLSWGPVVLSLPAPIPTELLFRATGLSSLKEMHKCSKCAGTSSHVWKSVRQNFYGAWGQRHCEFTGWSEPQLSQLNRTNSKKRLSRLGAQQKPTCSQRNAQSWRQREPAFWALWSRLERSRWADRLEE